MRFFFNYIGSNSLLPSDYSDSDDSDVVFEKIEKRNGHTNGRISNGESEEIRA